MSESKTLQALEAFVLKQEGKVTNAQQDILRTDVLAEFARLVYEELKWVESDMHGWPKPEG